MTDIDIFNLDNLEESEHLSRADIEKELAKGKNNSIGNLILDLFKIKSILTINEIVIGLAVKYKLKRKRITVFSLVSSLKRKGFLKKIGSGTFTLINYEEKNHG